MNSLQSVAIYSSLEPASHVCNLAVVMVSAGDCSFDGKRRLYFIPDKAKVNDKIGVETLLSKLVQGFKICFAIWLHLSQVK